MIKCYWKFEIMKYKYTKRLCPISAGVTSRNQTTKTIWEIFFLLSKHIDSKIIIWTECIETTLSQREKKITSLKLLSNLLKFLYSKSSFKWVPLAVPRGQSKGRTPLKVINCHRLKSRGMSCVIVCYCQGYKRGVVVRGKWGGNCH